MKYAYLAAFAFYGLSMILPSTALVNSWPAGVSSAKLILQAISIVLLLICIARGRFRPKRLVPALLILCVVVSAAFIGGSFGLVWLVLFILAARGVSLRQLALTNSIVNASVVVVLTFLAAAGAIDNIILFRDESLRYAMGFLQPNSFGRSLASISIGLFVCRFGGFKFTDYVLQAALCASCFLISGSRTSAATIALVILFMVLTRNRNAIAQHMSHAYRFASALFIVLVVLSLYLAFAYDPTNPVMEWLNSLLTDRIYYMNYYVSTYPPTLFGQDLERALTVGIFGLANQLILDNSWIYCLEVFGVIPTVILVFLTFCLMRNASLYQGLTPFPYLLILSTVFSFSEATAFNPFYSYYLVGAAVLVLDITWDDYLKDGSVRVKAKMQRHSLKSSQVY